LNIGDRIFNFNFLDLIYNPSRYTLINALLALYAGARLLPLTEAMEEVPAI
jgi:hypothetical protein